ncbi:MAG: signal peptidase II [Clostridia bacterium]
MYIIFAIVFLGIVVLDQISKFLVQHNMILEQSIPVVNNFFSITYIHNYGAAFGMLENQRILFISITCILCLFLLYYYFKKSKGTLEKIAIALILGGAIGNFIDRFFLGYVIDFLHFGSFYIFNIADSAVCVGATLYILNYIFEEKKNKKEANNE